MRSRMKTIGLARLLALLSLVGGSVGPAFGCPPDPPGGTVPAGGDDDRPVGSLPMMMGPGLAPLDGGLWGLLPVPEGGGDAYIVDDAGRSLVGPIALPSDAAVIRLEIYGEVALKAAAVLVFGEDGSVTVVGVPKAFPL